MVVPGGHELTQTPRRTISITPLHTTANNMIPTANQFTN